MSSKLHNCMYKAFIGILFLSVFSEATAQTDLLTLDEDMAKRMAALPLHCIETEYPNKLNQVLTDSTYLDSPKKLHPVFYGCFDWHSSVHGHWLLATVLNQYPEADFSKEIIALFDQQFTPENVAAELKYFEPKLEKSFERTYGWAWLLKLHAALVFSPLDKEHGWSKNLQPLTDFIVTSYKEFLPKLVYPIRVGEHSNTAFGLSLALDYANTLEDRSFWDLISNKAKEFYLNDCDCPLNYEPSGFDFISPCLQEAELMSKIMYKEDYEKWLKKFLPDLFKKKFTLEPGKVLDRNDGKLVHLDGLNFLRAQNFYAMAFALPENWVKFRAIGDQHLQASMNYVSESDYMGSHWLATFLVYALEQRNRIWMVEVTK